LRSGLISRSLRPQLTIGPQNLDSHHSSLDRCRRSTWTMFSSISRLLPSNINLNPLESDLFRSSHTTSSRAIIDGPEPEEPPHGGQPPPSQSHHSDTTTHDTTQNGAADAAQAQAGKRHRKDPASYEVCGPEIGLAHMPPTGCIHRHSVFLQSGLYSGWPLEAPRAFG
jgi:hypothetical protein